MSRRMTRSQTIFLENPASHFKHLIKNPKISTSTKSKTRPVKPKIDASMVRLESKNVSVPVKSQDSSTNGIADSSKMNQLAVNEPISSSKPIKKVRSIRRNTTPETIATRPSLDAIASTSNSGEQIQTIVEQSLQDASVTSQPTATDQNMSISSKRKTFSSSTPRFPERRSERLKKSTPIFVQPKKTVNQKTAVSNVVHSVPAEVSNANHNVPSSSTETIARRRKTKTDESKKPAEDKISRLKLNSSYGKIEIIIPNELKALLIDDANIIKRQQKFYMIPATQNVAKIIDDYIALKQPTEMHENHNEVSIIQIFGSIIEYFDTLLAKQLLYESERMHHFDVMNNFPDENVSKLYTPIYLLRLLIQLNSLIEFSEREKGSLQSIVNYVNEFVKYLAENQSIFSDMNSFNQ